MKNLRFALPYTISLFFSLLFIYAALSKLRDFENFQVQLAQSPLLSAYAGFISYAVIGAELLIAGVLLWERLRLIGIYLTFALMVSFTVYIYLIMNYSDFIPCSCGGILEKMGWREHLIFNLGCVFLAAAAVMIMEKERAVGLWRQTVKMAMMFLLGSGGMVVLFVSSENIIKKENNFIRRFLLHPVMEEKSMQLANDQYYFAGSDRQALYLRNRKYPLTFTTVDTALDIRKTEYLKPDRNYAFSNIVVKARPPFFYIYDGSVPVIFRGKIGAVAAKTISFQDAYFNQLEVIDSTTFALRSQSAETKFFSLARLALNEKPKLQLHPQILTKQVDGVFDMDGSLLADPVRKEIAYIYSYRNEFIVTDQQLKVINRLHTIDTTKIAQVATTRLSNGTYKMGRPPLKVNNGSVLYAELLFNRSSLMGKYESRKAWRKADIIDIYLTGTQHYIGSLYLYRKTHLKLNDFLVTENFLYAIHGDRLTKYRITGQILKYFQPGEAENPFQE
ncbi:DoxX family protein [Kaistella palustris]|uniref:DoxX family protein n=1 Tax=Kaistella palustris TaxID=493376 RepID=UPI0003FBE451|nr:MauE/DoxX family redox-associated membrane protein [Kaistella palustris]